VRPLVQKYWGNWKRGDYRPPIPVEPPQQGPRTNGIAWATPTLPWVVVSFHGPAYSDEQKDQAALDLISFLGFSESSALYQKLVIQEQKVDTLQADSPDRVDPYLFSVWARLKKPADLDSVRQDILATLETFKEKPVEAQRLEDVKRHLRYSFALSLNNSETVAGLVARYVALRRTPETINRLYDLYERITPEDIRSVARKYLVDNGRTIVTLTGGKAQ
jgi:zinc protease